MHPAHVQVENLQISFCWPLATKKSRMGPKPTTKTHTTTLDGTALKSAKYATYERKSRVSDLPAEDAKTSLHSSLVPRCTTGLGLNAHSEPSTNILTNTTESPYDKNEVVSNVCSNIMLGISSYNSAASNSTAETEAWHKPQYHQLHANPRWSWTACMPSIENTKRQQEARKT